MTKTDKGVLKKSHIAKNTIFLYTRTLIMMLIGLYSGRVTLDMLGAEGYGTYQAVGGCIAILWTINAGISSAISRFITYELGKKNMITLSEFFSSSLNVLAIFCAAIILIAETFGLWFVHTQMKFPAESMGAVSLIFQLTLISYVLGVLVMPFMSILIAYEEFKCIATLSLIQGIVQFAFVLCISLLPSDRLEWYAWSLFFTSVVYQFSCSCICIRKHPQIRYSIGVNKEHFKQILSFASFSYIGDTAGVLREQGATVLINTFFGVVPNAALGVANSVRGAVSSLVGSFSTALSPQITKSYAAGDYDYMWDLVASGIRYSYFLLFILAAPVLASAEWILGLWLKEVPSMAIHFTQLTIVALLCNTLSTPLIYLANATGKIALYQCIVGGILLLTIPISFLLLYTGFTADVILWVNIFMSISLFIVRLLLIRRLISFKIMSFLYAALPRIVNVSIVTTLVTFGLTTSKKTMQLSFAGEAIIFFSVFLITVVIITFVGLTRGERYHLYNKVLVITGIKKRICNF